MLFGYAVTFIMKAYFVRLRPLAGSKELGTQVKFHILGILKLYLSSCLWHQKLVMLLYYFSERLKYDQME